MKHLRYLALLSSFSILFFSCQKELSVENGNAGNSSSQWEFSEATNFKGNIDTAYLEPSGGVQSLVFEGSTPDGKGQIFMQLLGTSVTATSFRNPNVVFEYSQNNAVVYSNVPSSIDKFTVVITTIDATSVTGTFSGEVADSVGQIKTITNGKFTAVLKTSTTPPLLGICKIQNIGYLDSATGFGFGSLTSIFNSANNITKTQFRDSSSNVVLSEYNFTYSATRINIDTAQYFELDASGRIKSFYGYVDTDVQSQIPKVKIDYTFDTNGYLTKAAYSPQSQPSFVFYVIDYTWTNGNLTKTVESSAGSLEKKELEYQYDITKTPKQNMCFFLSGEIFYTQGAINYGKNSTNVISKSIARSYDPSGNLDDQSEATYSNYQLNAQNYVTSFNITGDGSILFGGAKYVLTYKCF